MEEAVDALKVSSKIWKKTESTGHGVYTYENTSVFSVDLKSADYEVTVTFENPTATPYIAYVRAENITKVSDIQVGAGETVSKTFTAVLVDGQLNLKFLKTSSAVEESAASPGSVYVSRVQISPKAVKSAGEKPTIYLASDSTVQTYDSYYYPQAGWGETLHNFFGEFKEERNAVNSTYGQSRVYETANVIVENRAIGGRSSQSFIDEGKLDDLLEDVRPGDYLFLQWGHNDATTSRPNRFVSVEDFPDAIQYYIDGAIQRGVTPVLVTPVARRSVGSDGKFASNFEGYRQVMLRMGEEQGVPVLDLTAASIELCNSFGADGAKSLFLHLEAGEYDGAYKGGVADDTHLQYYGAYKFAQCVAKLINEYEKDNQLNDLKNRVVINIPTEVPEVVSNVVTGAIGATSVTFSWDEAEGAELYYIYRQELTEGQTVANVDFSGVDKYSVSATTKYTDKNCVGGHTYAYAVRGFNEKGLGEFSSIIVVETKSALHKIDFNLNSTDETMPGYIGVHSKQAYNPEVGYGWTTIPSGGRDRGLALPDSNALTREFCFAGEFAYDLPNGDYEIKIYSGDLMVGGSTVKSDFWAEGVAIGTISARQTAGTLTAMVRVVDGQLNVRNGGQNGYINGLEITPILGAPSMLNYTEMNFNPTNVTFLINFLGINEAATYRVYQKGTSDSSFNAVKTIAAEDIGELHSMVANYGEVRQYYVTAVLADGTESARSNVIEITMIDPDAVPPAIPANVKIHSASRGNIHVVWDAVEGATSYNIYRSTRLEGMNGYKGFTKVGDSNTPYFYDVDSDLHTNIPYYYIVEAVGKGGIGEKSSPVESPVTEILTRQKAENLADRALVAIDLAGDKGAEVNVTTKDVDGNELTSGVYLSWRLFESDPEDITFSIYRNDNLIQSNLTVTNCVDLDGKKGDVYKVVGSSDASLGLTAKEVGTWENYFLEFQLNKPAAQTLPDGLVVDFTANDMSVGDLDGDGDYELIVKWASNSKDNSHAGYTGTTILDAYNIDTSTGTAELMWRIDLGVNIRTGAHYTQFQVWDFDGDGKAELICKTADGSTSYQNQGGTLVQTSHVGAVDASQLPVATISDAHDYRNSSGYVLSGPEYLTAFDGVTGKVLATADYIPARGSVDAWGDGYGNRVDRFLSAVAYLDGETPSAVFARGYYSRTCLTAYDLVDTNGDEKGDTLQVRWNFDSNNYPKSQYGEVEAQGNHGLSVNDVDGDGKDEIVYGAIVIEHDGTLKYTTGLGHGDAMHVSDWIPSRPGLEVFSVHEHTNAAYQVEIRDAETGEILWGYFTGKDTGRGVAADVDPNYIGAEMWANAAWDGVDGGLYSSMSTFENFIKISESTPDVNFSLFWDGDLLSELQNHSFDNGAYVPLRTNITKWNYEKQTSEKLLDSSQIHTSNGTKGNVGLVVDILGDWREEIIARSSADDSKVRIYTSTIITDYKIPTLMENDGYRLGIAWQNVGYNQPANLDYLLSEGLLTSQLKVGKSTASSASILFTEASDGKYGHDVTGYAIYRAGEDGEYQLVDSLSLDQLVEVAEDGTEIEEPREPVEYKFDFGNRNGQDGWIQILSTSDAYEIRGTYGFTTVTKGLEGYGGQNISYTVAEPELNSVYDDAIRIKEEIQSSEFIVNVPNGKYEVTYYFCSGTGISGYNRINVEGKLLNDFRIGGGSGTTPHKATGIIEVADSTLNVTNTCSKTYASGGSPYLYWNGLTIKEIIEELPPVVVEPTDTTYYGYTDFNVTPNTEYSYKVAAIVNGRTSFKSLPVTVKTLVDIKSVVNFTLEDLVEDAMIPEDGSLEDLLPAQVEVIDSEDNQVLADIKWDVTNLDITTAGEYEVVGTIEGYLSTVEKTVKVIPNTIVSYSFEGYEPVSDVEPYYVINAVQKGELELPEKIIFTYLNKRTQEVNVTWDVSGVSTNELGTYPVEGTAELPKFGAQTVKISVEVKSDYIAEFDSITPVEAAIGSNKGELITILPQQVNVTYKSGKKDIVDAIWDVDSIDEQLLLSEGEFVVQGTVEGYSNYIFVKVVVNYRVLWKFDLGINAGRVAPGWEGVTVNPKGGKKTATELGVQYTQEKGYGFENGAAVIEGRDEIFSQDGILPVLVYTDFALPDGQTFIVDVPNGVYNIEFTSASTGKSTVKVQLEGSSSIFSVGNSAGTYNIGVVKDVHITDGNISMYFTPGTISRLASIVIRQVSVGEPATKADTTVLIAAVEAANALVELAYTAESYAVVREAISAAEAVLANEKATQEVVDAAADVLINAIEALEPAGPIAVNKEMLILVVGIANGLVESGYTPESYTAVREAVLLAEAVLDNEEATQEAVDIAAQALSNAIAALVPVGPMPVDKAALTATLESAKTFAEGDYTEESFATLKTAILEAEAVLANEEATKEEVNAALEALINAISALEKAELEEADKAALIAALDSAKVLAEADYTAESYGALRTAIAAAEAVLANEAATQEAVNAALETLTNAISALEPTVPGPVDPEEAEKAALVAALESAKALAEADYTAESYGVLSAAILAAEAVLADEKATQEAVNTALAALTNAKSGLVLVDSEPVDPEEADKAALRAVLESAKTLAEADYTAESYGALGAAILAAEAVLVSEEATQEIVDAALAALNNAITALEPAVTVDPEEVNKGVLTAAVEAAKALAESEYTAESYVAVREAILSAEAVLVAEEATQEIVNAALKALTDAVAALVKKAPVDPVDPVDPAPVPEIPAPTPTPAPKPAEIPANKGGDKVEGWNGITKYLEQIKEDKNTTKVTITAGDVTVLPKEAIEAIQGKNITIEVKFEGYSWIINGKDVTGEKLADIDLSIRRQSGEVSKAVIEKVAGENSYIPLQLAHNGDFGLHATLSIDLEKDNGGKIANLFYYNPKTKTLELQSVDRVDNRGNANLNFTHASEYIVVIDDTALIKDEIKDIKVTASETTLYVGGTAGKTAYMNVELPDLIKEAVNNKASNIKVTYKTSDRNVVRVLSMGKLTANTKGTAIITTTVTIDDVTMTYTTEITVKNASINVLKEIDAMELGSKFTFEAEVYGLKKADITFNTTEKSIVVIDKKTGEAVAKSKGTDYVVIKCGKITKNIKVVVK